MKIAILQRSYWDITNDWSKTIQLVMAPWLFVTISNVGLNFYYLGSASVSRMAIDTLPNNSPYHIAETVLLLAEVVIAVWIAVAWHRYILLKEHPTRHLPKWFGMLNWQYLGRLILVSLISTTPFIALIAIYSKVFGAVFDFTHISRASGANLTAMLMTSFFGTMIGSYLFLRFGVVLPAIATQRPIRIREAWHLTKMVNIEIFGCSIVLGFAYTVIGVINQLFNGFDVILLVMMAATGFASLMSLSLLTSFYGYLTIGMVANQPTSRTPL